MYAFVADVSLSSDFIAGFCGETEDDHQQTLSLLEIARYSVVYAYPYSMREVLLHIEAVTCIVVLRLSVCYRTN